MKAFIAFIFITLLSCNENRKGIPESERNYSNSSFITKDKACMTASDGIFVFNKLNADSIEHAIRMATLKYFGDNFATKPMQNSIHQWLTNDFFSTKTHTNIRWTLAADVNRSKLSCNYHSFHGLEDFNLHLFFENNICLKKLIGNLGSYEYIEDNNGISYKIPKNRLRFLCDFNIDIRYRPKSLFNSSKEEYYRVTIKDTVDMFTALPDSNFVYR